jgi:hypothetical protein
MNNEEQVLAHSFGSGIGESADASANGGTAVKTLSTGDAHATLRARELLRRDFARVADSVTARGF